MYDVNAREMGFNRAAYDGIKLRYVGVALLIRGFVCHHATLSEVLRSEHTQLLVHHGSITARHTTDFKPARTRTTHQTKKPASRTPTLTSSAHPPTPRSASPCLAYSSQHQPRARPTQHMRAPARRPDAAGQSLGPQLQRFSYRECPCAVRLGCHGM